MLYSDLWILGDNDHLTSIETDENGIITNVSRKETSVDPAKQDFFVTPGFIDTHIHGAFGFDTSDHDAKGICEMAYKLASVGTAAFLPTTMTISSEEIDQCCASVFEAIQILKDSSKPHAEILGIRLEGPIFNTGKCGVQDPKNCISPSDGMELISELERKYPGLIKIIDISPELEGSLDLIDRFKDRFVFSLAHTDADHDIAQKALLRGAKSITHALNAMRPILKRSTGVLGAAIDMGAYIEVISDLHHIDKAMLRLLYSDVFEEKVITISDSMRGALMPDGIYDLGGTDVEVKGGRTYYGEGRDLAGSVTYLSEEFRNLMNIGVPQKRCVDSLTINVLRRMSLDKNTDLPGVIEAGRPATFNFFDKEYNLIKVINHGQET